MRDYLTHWQFWVAVVAVCLAVNWGWSKFTGKQGQLT